MLLIYIVYTYIHVCYRKKFKSTMKKRIRTFPQQNYDYMKTLHPFYHYALFYERFEYALRYNHCLNECTTM